MRQALSFVHDLQNDLEPTHRRHGVEPVHESSPHLQAVLAHQSGNRQRQPLQVVDQHVVHHRGPDRAVVSVQLSDPVSSDLVGLHLGPLDQQVELWIDLLHGAPKLEGEFLPLLLVSVKAHGTSFRPSSWFRAKQDAQQQ